MGGNAEGFYGAYAIGAGSLVEVTGDAISIGSDGKGAFAYGGGTVSVGGNAEGFYGANANSNGLVEVGGDVTW